MLNFANQISKYHILSWGEFDNAINKITEHYKDKKISAIYGEPRGGLPLAVALSHRLKVPLILDKKFIEELSNFKRKVLWVDDIIDTEKTYKENKKMFAYHCCWISRLLSTSFFSVDTSDKWVIFPWEVPEDAEEDKKRYIIERKEDGFLLND